MTELLLEIYGEEIPPSFQYEGKEKIKEAFTTFALRSALEVWEELLEVVEEESSRDEDFKRSWESLSTFRKNIETWKTLGYLK